MSDSGDRTLTVSPAGSQVQSLLVIDEGGSRYTEIAPGSRLSVGRDETADIRLVDPSVSRHHAELENRQRGLFIRDAGSHNGVVVNGVSIDSASGGWRRLTSRDVVEIGEATLIVRSLPGRPTARVTPLEPDGLRQRLEAEVARARRQVGSVAVLALSSETSGATLAGHISRSDANGWIEDGLAISILADTSIDEATDIARRFCERVSPLVDSPVSAGVAHMPTHAVSANDLIVLAREAAFAEAVGVRVANAGQIRLELPAQDSVIVADPAMRRTFALLRKLAAAEISIVIHGETGVGKENAARAVHHWSQRKDGPFVAVNCAALTESLIESEIFGHVAGSFSGATGDRVGYFESADGGTLFLDELGELPPAIQAKLLRVLDSGRFSRVGETKEREASVRIVGATNRDLDAEVAAGQFRSDLLYRLRAASVTIPPLRERSLEIGLLAELFLQDACDRSGRASLSIHGDALFRLSTHEWPGNIRELKNAIGYAAATVDGEVIHAWHLPPDIGVEPVAEPEEPARTFRPLASEIEELEKRRMREALEATGGVKTRAAKLLGMPRRTFTMKAGKYGID